MTAEVVLAVLGVAYFSLSAAARHHGLTDIAHAYAFCGLVAGATLLVVLLL